MAIVVGSSQTVLRNTWTALSGVTWTPGWPLDPGNWKTKEESMVRAHTSQGDLASLTKGWCCPMHVLLSRASVRRETSHLGRKETGVRLVCIISHVPHWRSKVWMCSFFLLTHLSTLSCKMCVWRCPQRYDLIFCIWKASLKTSTLDAVTVAETKAREVTWLDTQQLPNYLPWDKISGASPLRSSPIILPVCQYPST